MKYKTEQDLIAARDDFSSFNNILLSHIGGGEIVSMEFIDNQLSSIFDKYSGIDSLQVVNGMVRTIAMRVQWGVNYETFTIRYSRRSGAETEYTKRIKAIRGDKGFLFPHMTVQAYLDKRGDAKKILSACIVKTVDLYSFIERNFSKLQRKRCPEGNIFLVVNFDDLNREEKVVLFSGGAAQ